MEFYELRSDGTKVRGSRSAGFTERDHFLHRADRVPPCGGIPRKLLPYHVNMQLSDRGLYTKDSLIESAVRRLCDVGELELIESRLAGHWLNLEGERVSDDVYRFPMRLATRNNDFVPFDDERIKKYMGKNPTKYKGQLAKLSERYSGIRRDATAADRERFENKRLRYVYSPAQIYEHTEAAEKA
jgi:hypothetical protein